MELTQESKQLCDRIRTCYISTHHVGHIGLFGDDSGEGIGLVRQPIYSYRIKIPSYVTQTTRRPCDPLPSSCWVQRRSLSKSEKNLQYTPDYLSKKHSTGFKHKFAHR